MNIEEIISNINFYNVALFLNGTVLILFGKHLLKKDKDKERKINLKKEKTPYDVSKVIIPPKVSYSEKNIYRFIETKYYVTLKNFIEKLEKKFDKNDLAFLYNNLNTLKINDVNSLIQKIIFKKEHKFGEYNYKENTINITQNDFETTLLHELFHMASTIYTEKGTFSGFKQSYFDNENNKIISFGSGLNEGYTEYLTKRYFAKDVHNSNYRDLVSFVREIENIIGYKKMEKLYFHANLKGLIEELSEYISEEEIMKFIINVDFYNQHKYDKDTYGIKENVLKEIDSFLEQLKENAKIVDETKQNKKL